MGAWYVCVSQSLAPLFSFVDYSKLPPASTFDAFVSHCAPPVKPLLSASVLDQPLLLQRPDSPSSTSAPRHGSVRRASEALLQAATTQRRSQISDMRNDLTQLLLE